MTLQQEAYAKIACLPENSIRLVIALVDEMLKQSSQQPASTVSTNAGDTARSAFQEAMEYRRLHPFPKDMDWEKLREEAVAEKYGRFD